MISMLTAATRLADVLERENAALTRLDFPSATALLDAKRIALTEFEHAGIAAVPDPALRATALRLLEASRENKRLLERAMRVQHHIMSLLAQAAGRAAPHGRYGVEGTHISHAAAPPFALSARV